MNYLTKFVDMKFEADRTLPNYRKCYCYPCDLEALSTIELLKILDTIRRVPDWIAEDMMYENNCSFDGCWVEYDRDREQSYHTMKWMVKKVLATRPHVETSKIIKKRIRQYQAKHRIKLK